MKLQFETGRLRLRVERAEFAALREGGRLEVRLGWPQQAWHLTVAAGEVLGLRVVGDSVALTLPAADLVALAARAPWRDGLRYALDLPDGAVDLRFEVDLHDGRARPR